VPARSFSKEAWTRVSGPSHHLIFSCSNTWVRTLQRRTGFKDDFCHIERRFMINSHLQLVNLFSAWPAAPFNRFIPFTAAD
jgi:hypothetical protein